KSRIFIISFPHVDFINRFSIYRNSYRILIGFYFIPASLTIEERLRPKAIFPLILKPYNSNFQNIIKVFKTITKLDEGIIINIPRKSKARLYAFPIYYIGDIL
ncbi:hypothetical protein QBC45DRAFT_332994, partial [Copromyces sp. CBS 386.78]